MVEEELSPEEAQELRQFLGAGAPAAEEKHTVHKFLHDVSISRDTTKTGNLKDEEIGVPRNPVRTQKGIALICQDIIGNDFMKNHFINEAEIITSTSLSRDAKLLTLSVIQKRQLEDVTKTRKVNKGWFGQRKESKDDE